MKEGEKEGWRGVLMSAQQKAKLSENIQIILWGEKDFSLRGKIREQFLSLPPALERAVQVQRDTGGKWGAFQ